MSQLAAVCLDSELPESIPLAIVAPHTSRMNLPPQLAGWATQLRDSCVGNAQILNNLQADACVSTASEIAFHDTLLSIWTAQGGDPLAAMLQAVASSPQDLLFQGKDVSPGLFPRLCRICKVSDLAYWATATELIAAGLIARELKDAALPGNWSPTFAQTVRDLVDILNRSGRPVCPGKPNAVVWSTPTTHRFADAREAINRVALPHLLNQPAVVVVSYNRPPDQLVVPRTFDAGSHDAFRPNPNCAEENGWTAPLVAGLAKCEEVIFAGIALVISCDILE